MLNLKSITSFLRKSSFEVEVIEPDYEALIGTPVFVDTLCCGDHQLGFVVAVVPSPFYGQTGMTAFVCGNGWTEYLPLMSSGE